MDLQEEEIRALVRETFLEGGPIVRVSAATGEGLPELVSSLDLIAAGIPGKDSSNLFRLPVDRSFSMKGFGTVVTGTGMRPALRSAPSLFIFCVSASRTTGLHPTKYGG
jgi:selenocysteine-specific elongation factor